MRVYLLGNVLVFCWIEDLEVEIIEEALLFIESKLLKNVREGRHVFVGIDFLHLLVLLIMDELIDAQEKFVCLSWMHDTLLKEIFLELESVFLVITQEKDLFPDVYFLVLHERFRSRAAS